jgi:hypothetical protein
MAIDYFCIGVIFGFLLFVCLQRMKTTHSDGVLRMYTDVDSNKQYLFVELAKEPSVVLKKKQVVFDVEVPDIPQE